MNTTTTPPLTAPVREVDPRGLAHLPTKNPNVMDPHTFDALVASIKRDGFLQPILVVEENDKLLLIDGVHRTRAAIEAGLVTIPAVIAPDRGRAEILRIALNKMRGELDLSEIGRQLQQLLDTGLTNEDLTYTGFASWEVDALLESSASLTDADLDGADTSPPAPATKAKTYSLTFRFDSESHRARVREALESLSDEGDLTEGLEVALDNVTANWRNP